MSLSKRHFFPEMYEEFDKIIKQIKDDEEQGENNV